MTKKDIYSNKGLGLKLWFKNNNLSIKNFNVLHIGDQDTGLINDTLIKKFIPQTFIIMVGNKCDLNNKDVDCYLPTNPEKSLFYFLKNLVFLFYH